MIAKLYQMRTNEEDNSKLFASLEELGDSKINLDDYDLVGYIYLDAFIPEFGEDVDNLLEGIFAYGNSSEQFYKENPNARSISMSDIIEINGDHYYVDRFGFANVNEKLENIKIEESVEESIEIVNKDEEVYDRLYIVYVDAGAGGVMYPYKVKALNEAHALEILSAYLLKDAPGLVTRASEVEDVEEAMENDIYVDGTLEGAEEPVYFNINTRIEDITDEPLKESVEDYKDKVSISYMAKIFAQMKENGWDGNHETADKYFDDIMRKVDPNFKESEPVKDEEPLREGLKYNTGDHVWFNDKEYEVTEAREAGYWEGESADGKSFTEYSPNRYRIINPLDETDWSWVEEAQLEPNDNNTIKLPSQENSEETRKFINGYLDAMYNKEKKVGIEESKLEESKKLEEDNHEMEHEEGTDPHLDEEGNEKSILDYIQDRIGQVITIGEFNTIMQSIFGMFNEVFLQVSEVYNQDPGQPQEVTIWDDEDAYVITYNIVDEMEPTIEITDVEIQ